MNNEKKYFMNNFRLINKIGSGSFGDVFLVHDNNKNKDYACKIEEKDKSKRLYEEYIIYKKLRENGVKIGIPKVYNFIETKLFNIMIMELLEHSLEHIYNQLRFDLGTCLKIGYEIITLLENIHNAEIIHRDIKPSNFLIGYKNNKCIIYILDFGLSKQYIEKNKHINIITEKSLIGTARYASINVHMGIAPSRRDDLESLGYMLLFFMLGKLPWQGLKKRHDISNIEQIGEVKMCTDMNKLCKKIPSCFFDYITYCRKLRYQETPDYDYLKKLFIKTAEEKKCELRYIFDKNYLINNNINE